MNRDLVKATLLTVVCVIALGESLLLGSVVWHGAMDKSPLTVDGPTCVIKLVKP